MHVTVRYLLRSNDSTPNIAWLRDIDIGVIIAAVIMWKLSSPARFYADPAISMIISFVIFASAIPLSKHTYIIHICIGIDRYYE